MPASRCGPEAFCDQVSREVVYAAENSEKPHLIDNYKYYC